MGGPDHDLAVGATDPYLEPVSGVLHPIHIEVTHDDQRRHLDFAQAPGRRRIDPCWLRVRGKAFPVPPVHLPNGLAYDRTDIVGCSPFSVKPNLELTLDGGIQSIALISFVNARHQRRELGRRLVATESRTNQN